MRAPERRWALAVAGLALAAASPEPTGEQVRRWGDPVAGKLIEQGLHAVRAKKFDRAARLSQQLQKAYPAEPARLAIDFATSVELYSSNAAALFARMAAERATILAPPLPLLEPEQVRRATYVAGGVAGVRMARAIVESGWSPGPGASEPISARRTLIDDALARDDVPEALKWLDGIDDPFTLGDFLILEEYRRLRPAIVARWGDDLAKLDRWQGEMLPKRLVGADPPPLLVAQHVRWLTEHGRAAEALATAAPATAAIMKLEQGTRSTLAVAVADAAARAGSPDRALALLSATADSLEPASSAREFALQKRALMLGDLGRAPEALAVANILKAKGNKDRGWMEASARRIAVCAAEDAGDRTTARRELAALLDLGDSEMFKAQGLLCLGEADQAAAMIVIALRRRRGGEVVRWLQDQPAPAWGRWQRRWDAGFAAMRDRGDVRQALAGYAVVNRFAMRPT